MLRMTHEEFNILLGMVEPSGVVVPGEVGILLIYAPIFFKRPGKG